MPFSSIASISTHVTIISVEDKAEVSTFRGDVAGSVGSEQKL